MNHLPEIIRDLAIILMTASVVSVVFVRFKLPLILGYMAAGFLLSPAVTFFPNILEQKTISIWAEIGVIFMLFNLGIEFSFRNIGQLGSRVFIIVFFQMASLFSLGFLFGKFLSWDNLQSTFLGSMICVSSTAIILKAFDEYKLKTKLFAQLVIGVLVLEDLLAILLIVILTTLGLTQTIQGSDLVLAAGKLIFYLAMWLVFGLFAIPALIAKIKGQMTDEIALVVSLGLCLAMVVIAVTAGFSAALGAFVMGSILGETEEKERIEKLLHPVKDLFSAVFFVSIGMLVDVKVFSESYGMILMISAIVIGGNIFAVTTAGMIGGVSLRNSIFASLALAQIGELSFIIANLGLAVKVTDQKLYSVIVAVSVLTTMTTPLMLNFREHIGSVVEKLVPRKAQLLLANYSQFSFLVGIHQDWKEIVKRLIARIALNSVVIIALTIGASRFLVPMLFKILENARAVQMGSLAITVLIAAPFFWGIIFSKSRDEKFQAIIRQNVSRRSRKILFGVRSMYASLLLIGMISQFVSTRIFFIISFLFIFLLILFLLKFMGPIYHWFEMNFVMHSLEPEKKHNKDHLAALAPWDAHLEEFVVAPESLACGHTLSELGIREKYGVSIAMIQRGEIRITAPGKDVRIMPSDKIYIIGDDSQIEKFATFIEQKHDVSGEKAVTSEVYSLNQYLITENSPFLGKAIRHSGIREATSSLVVGIERNGQRILNPDSLTVIEVGDLLWLVGDKSNQKYI